MAPSDGTAAEATEDALRARIRELEGQVERLRDETSELRFVARLAVQARDSLIGTDGEGRILSWSLGAEELFGPEVADATGRVVEEIILAPQDRHEEAGRRESALREGVWQGTVRERGADGESFRAWVRISPLRDEQGTLRGFLRIDRNVTDQTLAEQSLRESEQRLRTLIENSLDITFELSADGEVCYASSRVEALLELQPSRLVGRPFRELVHPDERERQDEHLRQVLRTGARVRSTVRLGSAGGRWRWFECAAQGFAPSDRGQRAVVVARDITARRGTEQAIQEQERRLRLMSDALPVWIAYIDRDRRFAFNNATYERWFGIPAASTLGRTLWEVIGEPAYGSIRAQIDATLEGQAVGFETRIEDGEGAVRQVQIDFVPHVDPDGTVLGFYGLVQDISARIEAARRQERLVRELDHRVKNTLATVVALAEETLISASSEADFREAFIARIHTMARSHEALARTEWTGARLRELTESVLGPFFDGDEHRIEIEGAERFLHERAVLPLALSLHELAAQSLRHGALSYAGGHVRLAWTASPAEALRLRWTEARPSSAGAPPGEGAGLRLVEDLIRYEIDGRVESHLEGSELVWTLTLPGDVIDWERKIAPTAPEGGIALPSSKTGTALGLRVLVVEDDLIQTRLLGRLLERIGCEVVGPAGRVTEALALVEKEDFDCALLDIDLAGVVSTPVAERLGREGKPYIFLTGYADTGRLPTMPAGIALLRKPVDLESLATALRRAALPH